MKKYLLVIIGILLLPITVNAAGANIDFSASQKIASVGNTITVTANVNSTSPIGYYEYTLSYDHDKLELTKGNAYNVERADKGNIKSFKKYFTFKVKNSGPCKISAKSYAVSTYRTDESMSVTVNSISINSDGKETVNQSDNNNLKSLEIENYKLEPSFNKNTTNYIAKIEDDITEINIKATAEDSKASIVGDGKHSLRFGDNRIEITVTSENGEDKTYTIKVTLKEKAKIKVKVDGKTYSVIEKFDSFNNIKYYKTTKIKIDGNEVTALYNPKTDLTLVALKNDNNKTALYIYDKDKDSYTPYNEITNGSISILPIKSEEKLKNYELYTEVINNFEVECYKISSSSNFCAIYAMNLETGEKGWYMYDLTQNTIQRFNEDLDIYHDEKLKNTRKLIYILSATTLLFGITTIGFAIKSGKKRK